MFRSLAPLAPYFRRYKWQYCLSAFSVLAMNLIWVLFPQVVQRAVDALNQGVTRQKLLYYSLALVAVAVSKGVFQFLTRWVVIGISREIEYDLRNDLFEHLERLSYSFYQRTRTGDIMARATNDLNAVRMLLGPAIMYTANTVVFTAAALVFMWHISPKLTLYSFAPLPAASIVIQYFGKQIHQRFERIQAMFSDISARVQENLSGIRVIKAYAQEEPEIARFEADNSEYVARSLNLVRLMGMLWPTLELMLGMAVVVVLWVGGRQVLHGEISVGKFFAFMAYITMLTWPIIALGWVINIFQRGTASLRRLDELMKATAEVHDEVAADAPKEIVGEIEFRDLTFGYPIASTKAMNSSTNESSSGFQPPFRPEAAGTTPGRAVLKNISLRIPAGSSLAIVGPTGSGKSTLVSLIPRIYDAAPGAVLIDGRPVREYTLETLRRSIGFVPQETFLFSDSIRENIAFGIDGSEPTLSPKSGEKGGASHASDEEIHAAAEAANIAADIESFPEQYATIVGERGITLSGGQKQRTAIARALMRDPRILILDDALSSVDTYTEERILNHLRDVMRDRTTIFISHRVSTVQNADRIAVLHDGEIVEYGTHDELLARNGYYTELYSKQLLEEELAIQ